MHADRASGSEIEVGLQRFGGIDVDGCHQPSRFVGADRQHRQVGRPEPLADVGPMRARSRVAGEENPTRIGLDHEAAP